MTDNYIISRMIITSVIFSKRAINIYQRFFNYVKMMSPFPFIRLFVLVLSKVQLTVQFDQDVLIL